MLNNNVIKRTYDADREDDGVDSCFLSKQICCRYSSKDLLIS